jgi:16S rRNA G966 N2-methylase RsmD
LETSDTHHILVKSDCMSGDNYLEPLLQGHFPSSATIDLVVIDPPYGLEKADWDSSEDANKWVTENIPRIIDYCTFHERFDPTVKFLIFHHFDNPHFWV